MICHSYTDSSILRYTCDEMWFLGTKQDYNANAFQKNAFLVAKDVETLDVHTFTCKMYKFINVINARKLSTAFKMWRLVWTKSIMERIMLNHFCFEREKQEFFQEKTHFSRNLFRKKWQWKWQLNPEIKNILFVY